MEGASEEGELLRKADPRGGTMEKREDATNRNRST